MNTAFIAVLLMSATGTLLVLCLALLRPVTKNRFSAAWHYRTYMLVVFFLLVPIGAVGGSLLAIIPNESGAEMPNVPVIINDMIAAPQNNTDLVQQQGAIQNPNIPVPAPVETTPTPAPVLTLNVVLSYTPFVWLGGVVLFILWHGIQLVRFRRRIHRTSLPIEDTATIDLLKNAMSNMRIKGNLYLSSNDIIKTPMLVGLIKTRLILPEVEMNDRELSVILGHELIHYKRRDLWVKSLALLANAIHWFNPAVYSLTKRINTFCEISCDERVVADMNMEERRFYGETILNVLCRVVSQHSGVYATLAESKKGIERRLSHMMSVKKNTKRIALISLVVAALLCLTGFAAASVMNIPIDEKEASVYFDNVKSDNDNSDRTEDVYSSNIAMNNTEEVALPERPSDMILLPAMNRGGYNNAKIEFIEYPETSEPLNPDDSYGFDADRGLLTQTTRVLADAALRCLYDMTGYQTDECYAFVTYHSITYCTIFFSQNRNVNNNFFSAQMDTVTGEVIGMTMWLSKFDISSYAYPTEIASDDYGSIARYFYEQSSYGNRHPIVRTEIVPENSEDKFVIRLYLENEEYYEMYIDSEYGLPRWSWGPYPAGYEKRGDC